MRDVNSVYGCHRNSCFLNYFSSKIPLERYTQSINMLKSLFDKNYIFSLFLFFKRIKKLNSFHVIHINNLF
jgi:hypothetical protein